MMILSIIFLCFKISNPSIGIIILRVLYRWWRRHLFESHLTVMSYNSVYFFISISYFWHTHFFFLFMVLFWNVGVTYNSSICFSTVIQSSTSYPFCCRFNKYIFLWWYVYLICQWYNKSLGWGQANILTHIYLSCSPLNS